MAAADVCDRLGLEVPAFDEGAEAKLREAIPAAGTSLRNPLDMGVPLIPAPAFERVLDVVAASKNVETIIAVLGMVAVLGGMFGPPRDQRESYLQALIEVPARVRDRFGKPVVVVLPVDGDEVEMIEVEKGRRQIRDQYLGLGIPVYPTLERAARAVANVAAYYAKK